MGTSACGKSTTARVIHTTLVQKGVGDHFIHHLQRDQFILNEGARILGKEPSNTSYTEAYEEISRVHEEDIRLGREGIKSKVLACVNFYFLSTVDIRPHERRRKLLPFQGTYCSV